MKGAYRPFWPAHVETSAQAFEARKQSGVDVEVETPGSGCSCAFGPRSSRACVDEKATMGLKDRRTGEVRRLAAWSFLHPWSRGPAPRPLFYCDECMRELRAVWGKPIKGLHPPAGADDFWRPSIGGMILHAVMDMNRRDREPEQDRSGAVARFMRRQELRRYGRSD
jgi:hypothetical protein